MEVIDSETTPNAADTTVVAMINVFPRIVIPELALLTIVLGNLLATLGIDAIMSSWLNGRAEHAHHLDSQVPDNIVIGDFIVTKPACIPLSTAVCL